MNPICRQVLDAIGEKVECVQYKSWIGYLPEGIFKFTANKEAYEAEIRRVGGNRAAAEWRELEVKMEPLARAAMALPAAALRPDPAVVFTAGRFLPQILPYLPATTNLLAPFSNIVNQVSSCVAFHAILGLGKKNQIFTVRLNFGNAPSAACLISSHIFDHIHF